MDETTPNTPSLKWLKVAYWVAALGITAALLWQMDIYTRRPSKRTLDSIAKLVKPQIQPGDAIAFNPSWMSGYAMSRKGYKGKLTPEDVIAWGDPSGPDRVWVLHTHVTTQSLPGMEGYEEISMESVKDAHMHLMKRVR